MQTLSSSQFPKKIEERKKLTDAFYAGASYNEIALERERLETAIQRQIKQMQLYIKPTRAPCKRCSAPQEPYVPYPDILTAEEVCELLWVGYNAVYEILNSGKLKGHQKRKGLEDSERIADRIYPVASRKQTKRRWTPTEIVGVHVFYLLSYL